MQLCSGPDPAASLARAAALLERALAARADLVVLPEAYAEIPAAGSRPRDSFPAADPASSPLVEPFLRATRGSSAVVVLGGAPERDDDDPRTYNTALVLAEGRVVARYRKVHLFDATLADGTSLRESAHTRAGDVPVVVQTERAALGLSICYDLRFPEHYRALVKAGAEVLLVPSAFTFETGSAHWEPLLRARAIESQCFVVAAAQEGAHAPGRRSWGHAMCVDPWGRVIAQASPGEQVVLARLDPSVLERVRRAVPSLAHRVLGPETSARTLSFEGREGER